MISFGRKYFGHRNKHIRNIYGFSFILQNEKNPLIFLFLVFFCTVIKIKRQKTFFLFIYLKKINEPKKKKKTNLKFKKEAKDNTSIPPISAKKFEGTNPTCR